MPDDQTNQTLTIPTLEDGRLDIGQPIPGQCFRLSSSSPVQFMDADEDGRVPFKMMARSNKPVDWYGWAIYHDFSGMTHKKPSIPIDFLHCDSETIGFADDIDAGNDGLNIGGMFTPDSEDPTDYCRKMVDRGRKGVPYEASIDFRGGCVIEEVPVGYAAEVNGAEIEGPALIVRKWTLKAVAVCPHGRDPHTSTSFAARSSDANDELYSLTLSEFSGVTKTKLTDGIDKNANDKKPGEQQSETPADKPDTTSSDAGPSEQQNSDRGNADDDKASKADAELQQYVDAFGHELGSKYFLAGTSFADSTKQFHAHREEQWAAEKQALETKLAERDTKIADLEKKLGIAKDQLGDDAVESDTDADDDEQLSESDGVATDGVSRFAAGLKLPTKK